MAKIIAVVAFSWAHRGIEVQHFEKGERIETDDEDLIRVAAEEGWASDDGKVPKTKTHASAPENKADLPAEQK